MLQPMPLGNYSNTAELFLAQFVPDFGEQIDIGRTRRRRRRRKHLVRLTDDHEDDKCQDDEVDQRSDEATVSKNICVRSLGSSQRHTFGYF